VTRDRSLILVVDDAPDNVEIVRARLAREGYDVITAADGIEALALAAAHAPDLILLDVRMPRLDGIETVKRLRADPLSPFIPVIMLTAQGEAQDVVRGLDAGADEYLTKPFDVGSLLARVRAMLRMKALHDEVTRQAAKLGEWNNTLERRVSEQLDQLQRTRLLKRFLPPQIAELVLSSGEQILRSHRRDIVVVFCDLRAFTAFSEVAEPEEQIAMLDTYHGAVAAVTNRYRGTLIHIIGDGAMIVFNDPVPISAPSLQAVRAAIDMRARVGGLMAEWRSHGYDLGFAIGITRGFATLGLIGSEDRAQYTAIGTVTNLASRLCAAAADGQILIDRKVHAELGDCAAVEEGGELRLKGLSRPIRLRNVVALRDAAVV
jgi:DNA-binding response OmpR family regulator